MRILACFFILSLLGYGCTNKPAPVQVNGDLKFGQYIISPPKGYWYFPKQYPTMLNNQKNIFLVTFWEDKEVASRKTPPNKFSVFFNFGVSANTYKSIDAYYDAAKTFGVTYEGLPSEAEMLKAMANWSCKQTEQGIYGIECISLRDNVITVGAYGNDKDTVLSKLHLLQNMVGSFILQKGAA